MSSMKTALCLCLMLLTACGSSATSKIGRCPKELPPPDDALAALSTLKDGTPGGEWVKALVEQQETLLCARKPEAEICKPIDTE